MSAPPQWFLDACDLFSRYREDALSLLSDSLDQAFKNKQFDDVNSLMRHARTHASHISTDLLFTIISLTESDRLSLSLDDRWHLSQTIQRVLQARGQWERGLFKEFTFFKPPDFSSRSLTTMTADTPRSRMPAWFFDACNLHKKDEEDALDILYDNLDAMLTAKKWDRIDALMAYTARHASDIPMDLLFGIITLTDHGRHFLSLNLRYALYESTKRVAEERGELEVEGLFRGFTFSKPFS